MSVTALYLLLNSCSWTVACQASFVCGKSKDLQRSKFSHQPLKHARAVRIRGKEEGEGGRGQRQGGEGGWKEGKL